MARTEIGAMPWLMKKGKLHVVLITSRRRKRWILPKGQPEPDLKDREVAVVEAYEEAGVRGVLHGKSESAVENDGGESVRYKIYPLKVKRVLDKWPEDHERKRKILPWKEALEKLDDKAMCACVKSLVKQIDP